MDYSIFVDGLVAVLKSYALIVALCYALRAAPASSTPAGLYIGSQPTFFLLAGLRVQTLVSALLGPGGWAMFGAPISLFSLVSLCISLPRWGSRRVGLFSYNSATTVYLAGAPVNVILFYFSYGPGLGSREFCSTFIANPA